MASKTEQWSELAAQLRVDSIRAAHAGGSGHPTSSMSAADLMAVLMSDYLHYNYDDPRNPTNDHLIFSKGHASPLVYAMFKAAGAISDDDLLSFRKFGSPYQGHPTPIIPWVDVATGSLGQGLPIAVGVAIAGKNLDKLPYKTWVLCGDSEMAEGSMWEAFDKASYYNLSNLIAILDMNRLGQRGPTNLGWDTEAYAERAASFGWHVIEIDGHNLDEINRAFEEAVQPRDKPTFIIAKTMKGRGVSFLEDKANWHGKPTDDAQTKQAIEELGGERSIVIKVQHPEAGEQASTGTASPLQLPRYELGSKEATRAAYGDALKALGAARPDVVVLDAEVSNSTYAERFGKEFPDRFFEMFIAEQQMVAAAVGLSVRQYVPFASTFAAFLSRAYDFIRMGAISQTNIRLCGSHAGVSIGEDGPSQMALEDIAMMRAIHGSTVLYPSDANQTAHMVAAMADIQGISFLRITREKTAILYSPDETFEVGGSKVLKQSDADKVTIVAAGITVHEALKAVEQLAGEGTAVRLIDAYSVKPIDITTIKAGIDATGGRLIVVEDHWPEGGLGGAVLEALATSGGVSSQLKFTHLAVQGMPTSGTPQQLLAAAGIDAEHIANAVRDLI